MRSYAVCIYFVGSQLLEALRVFHDIFKGISRKCEGCFKDVCWVFQESSKWVSSGFQGYLRRYKGNSRNVSNAFQVGFKEIPCKLQGSL